MREKGKKHKNNNYALLGFGMVLANSSQHKISDLDKDISNTFREYRKQRILELDVFNNDEVIDEEYKNVINEKIDSWQFYNPISYTLIGNFSKCYTYLLDSYNFNNKYLHPQNILNVNTLEDGYGILYNYKVLTGSIFVDLSKKKESSHKAYLDDIKNKISQEHPQSNTKFVKITRIKVNSLLLYGNGGSFLAAVRNKLYQLSEDHIGKFSNYVQYRDALVIEAFGFNEIIVVTTWDCISHFNNFILEVRRLDLSDIESPVDDSKLYHYSLSKHVRDLSKISEEMPLETATVEPSSFTHIIDRCSSMICMSIDYNLNNLYKNYFASTNKELKILTTLSVKTGYIKLIKDAIDNISNGGINIKLLYGWQDLGCEDLYKDMTSSDIKNFLDKYPQVIEHTYSVILSDLTDDIDGFLGFNKKRYEYYRNKRFKNSEIRLLVKKMKVIGISSVVIQRTLYTITNFNKCISEPENFCFFIELRQYLDSLVFEEVESLYLQRVSKLKIHREPKERPSPEAKFVSDNVLNITSIERDLIITLKGFETAFTNRFIHSKDLAETSDVNYSYRGGIQQYLLIYEFINDLVTKSVFKSEDNPSTLYVSAYTHTESFPQYMRLNIFQIHEPLLFVSILMHEVTVHSFQRVIHNIFYREVNRKNSESSSLFDDTVSDEYFIKTLFEMGYDDDTNYFKYLCQLYGLTERKVTDKYLSSTLLYFLTDILLLKSQFNNDIQLFLYWMMIQFQQVSDNQSKLDHTFRESLVHFLMRMRYILSECSSSSEDIKLYESYLDDFKWKEVDIDADYVLNQILKTDNSFVELISKLESILTPTNIDDNLVNSYAQNIENLNIDTDTWKIKREEFEHDSKFERSAMSHYIGITYQYLKYYQINFPKIKIIKTHRVGTSESINSKDAQDYSSALFVDSLGGIEVKGVNTEKVIQLKIKYLQAMWHLAHIAQKRKLIKMDNQKVHL